MLLGWQVFMLLLLPHSWPCLAVSVPDAIVRIMRVTLEGVVGHREGFQFAVFMRTLARLESSVSLMSLSLHVILVDAPPQLRR